MSEIKFVGKCLLIKGNEKILVIGDLHLGFSEVMRKSGIMIPVDIMKSVLQDLNEIFERIGNVDKIVLLGDVKHEFGNVEMQERKEIGELMNYLRRKSKEVVLVKGNHDAIVSSIVSDLDRVELTDYYLVNDLCFMHGDKEFPQVHDKNIKTWIIAHGHPAISLEDNVGSKKEKYKCFLDGKFKGKRVIIVPSFFDVNEGTDPRAFDLGLAWDFELAGFEVKIVGENLEVLSFGKLRKL